MPDQGCTHIEVIATVKHRKRYECDECVKIGSAWVHLRTCQACASKVSPITVSVNDIGC